MPVNCKADRLSAFCTSRAKMSAIRTRHDKTTLLVTKGDNGHFRTLRAITYTKILNKSNAILSASACDFWFGMPGVRPPCPSPSSAPPAPPRPPPPLPLPVLRLCKVNFQCRLFCFCARKSLNCNLMD